MPSYTCQRCGREFATAPVLALHIERCVKLPEPIAAYAGRDTARARSGGQHHLRRYQIRLAPVANQLPLEAAP